MIAETLRVMYPGIRIGPGDDGDECVIGERGIVKWSRAEKQPTDAEIRAAEPAAIAAMQAKEAQKAEADTARDDAKRALSALDTIISGIDGATLAQAKTAIKQLAQIQRHIILATVGR